MSLDVQQVILGTQIAILRRQIPPIAIKTQILEGIRIAKELAVLEDITLDQLAIDALVAKVNITAQDLAEIEISIVAATIMAPVDIQGSYIMMPVDIQAQYVTLDINIKAKEVTLTIDIEAQHVGIYLQPEWAAKEGVHKNLYGTASGDAATWVEVISYTVTEGKTLYINDWGGYSPVAAGTQGACGGYLHNITDDIYLCITGGANGFQGSFTVPKKITSEKNIKLFIFNGRNITQFVAGYLAGYEI